VSKNIVVGIVTRQRVGMLQQCMFSAIMNAGDANVSVMAFFDDDEAGARMVGNYPWLRKVVSPMRLYYVRAANELCRMICNLDPAPDYFCIVDDDTEFVQTPWAEVCMQHLEMHSPGGMGILDLLSWRECCHIFTTPTFVKEVLGGTLYDTRYLQFYHDTALLYRVRNHFSHINDIDGRPFFIHKRDFVNGAGGTMAHIKAIDRRQYIAHAKAEGWSLYGDDLKAKAIR